MTPLADVEYELFGFDGIQRNAGAVELDMIFLGKAFRGRYVLIDSDRGVMGRDVLKSLSILFDGPHQAWSQAKVEGKG